MPGKFCDRPFAGIPIDARATPAVLGCDDAGLAQEMMHHRSIERVTTLGWSPTLTIERFSNNGVALPGTIEFGCMRDERIIVAELSQARHWSDQLMCGLIATVPMTDDTNLFAAIDDFDQNPFEQQTDQCLSLLLSCGGPDTR
jgi:hypothetical protein